MKFIKKVFMKIKKKISKILKYIFSMKFIQNIYLRLKNKLKIMLNNLIEMTAYFSFDMNFGKIKWKKITLILILVGLSFLTLGMKMQHDKNENERVLFYTNETKNKNYKTAKINLNQIKESTSDYEELEEEEEVVVEDATEEVAIPVAPVRVWYNPTNNGKISRGMGYSFDGFHFGYDLTSPLGSYETVYPIAEGVISGIFYDNAGARIVSVKHVINGVGYTSMYVHLSSYAPGIYIGKPVGVNDALGQMGTTGRSTGVHLHIEVADCVLYDANDSRCATINSYYNYLKTRYYQGFYGVGTILNLPNSWSVR